MKKIYMMAALLAAFSASASMPDILIGGSFNTSDPVPIDTVLSVANASRVVVTENPSGVKLEIRGTENDSLFQSSYELDYQSNAVVKSTQAFEMPYYKWKQRHQNNIDLLMFNGLHAGFCGTVDSREPVDVAMAKSFELGIDELISFRVNTNNRQNFFSVGLGINWRNYRMTGRSRFIPVDGGVGVGAYPDDAEGRFSRLKIFSLSFPVTYGFKTRVKMIGRETLNFKIGAILNWNSYGSLRTAWREFDVAESSRETVKTDAEQFSKHIGHRKFTVDILAAVQIAPQTGLYVKYSPMSLLEKGKGPDFQTISTGIYFGFGM